MSATVGYDTDAKKEDAVGEGNNAVDVCLGVARKVIDEDVSSLATNGKVKTETDDATMTTTKTKAGEDDEKMRMKEEENAKASTSNDIDEKGLLASSVASSPLMPPPPPASLCPFLDTINRTLLDFDFEPSCSVTLARGPHIYGCLVCGRHFRGKGRSTPAHTHSVESGHAVYVHLTNGTFHCLPDGYEVIDPSLDDIKAALRPTFTESYIRSLDRGFVDDDDDDDGDGGHGHGQGHANGGGVDVNGRAGGGGGGGGGAKKKEKKLTRKDSNKKVGLARDLFGRRYLPGFVGLNNLGKTDYINATVQALAHVRPLRDYFLRLDEGLGANASASAGVGAGGQDDVENGLAKKRNRDESNKDHDHRGRPKRQRLQQHQKHHQTRASSEHTPTNHSPLAKAFGDLIRKMWSDRRFKSTVDPHAFVQAVSDASDRRFCTGRQAEAGEFLPWLLNKLHVGLGGHVVVAGAGSAKHKKKKKKKKGIVRSSVIHDIFQGTVEVTTRQRRRRGDIGAIPGTVQKAKNYENGDDDDVDDRAAIDDSDQDDRAGSEDEQDRVRREEARAARKKAADEMIVHESTSEMSFLQLTLDIPDKPLFKDDEQGGLVIPQEPLVSVLRKFDGETFVDAVGHGGTGGDATAQKRRYRLRTLPNYLILHLNRFRRNEFGAVEKNPTIVAFPVKNLDLGRYVYPPETTNDDNDNDDDDENDNDNNDNVREKTKKKKEKKRKEKKKMAGTPPNPTEEQIRSMTVPQLCNLLERHGKSNAAAMAHGIPGNSKNSDKNRSELMELCIDTVVGQGLPDVLSNKYDLVANVTHHVPAEVGKETRRDPLQEGTYRCHVRHVPSNQWYEIQDLHVEETMPQLIGISECYVLIFERKGAYAAAGMK